MRCIFTKPEKEKPLTLGEGLSGL